MDNAVLEELMRMAAEHSRLQRNFIEQQAKQIEVLQAELIKFRENATKEELC